MKKFLFLLLFCVISIPAFAEIVGMHVERSASEDEMKASLRVINLMDEQGQIFPLKSFIGNGKPTLVTLWAHWCTNCRAEIPGYQAIAKTCADRWNIVFVSARAEDFNKDIAKYKTFGLPWRFYHVQENQGHGAQRSNEIKAFYGLTKDDGVLTPLHYLIASNGRVDTIVNAKMDFGSKEKLNAFCSS
jgi:thiol-disulfide isomerase/thioredoxin